MNETLLPSTAPEIDYAHHLATGRRLRSEAVLLMMKTAAAWFARPARSGSPAQVARACAGRPATACA